MFAFVALAAVALTSWLTIGAVFQAQRELFASEQTAEAPPWAWFGAPGEGRGPDGPPFSDGREAFRGVARTGLLAAFFAFLLATIVAGAVTRRLTRPLLALEEGARRLASGERGIRLTPPHSRDELRSLTETFNALVSGLERQESWRRGMVADIAHDLRTPLAVLRSEVEAMQDGVRPLDDAGLARLHLEVMRLSRLVEDLRTLSVAEGGGLGLSVETVAVGDFLEELLGAFAGRADEVGVDLRLAPVPAELTASFDPARLGRVLANLLDNALRYAAPGVVELSARSRVRVLSHDGREPGASPDGELVIAVRDNGPGLPEQEVPRLFERFYRGDPARARQADGGSGLGLSIAKALTEAHGGRLEAENHPDGGAVFTVVLPQPGVSSGGGTDQGQTD